jgi:hypothetical protein
MTAAAPKVFINYRRGETAGHAGRLYDALVVRFGEDNVFIDVEMEPGVDFVEKIVGVVGACDVLLVVIGPRWAAPAEGASRPRIAEPDDFVRLEIRTALQRADVRVVPVLVADAHMPDAEILPEDLKALSHRNALELSDLRWRDEVEHLMEAIDGGGKREEPAPRRSLTRRQAQIGGALAALIVAVIALLALRSDDPGSPSATTTAFKPVRLTVVRPGEAPPPTPVRLSRAGQQWVGTFEGNKDERVALDLRDVSERLSGTISILDRADFKVLDGSTGGGLILSAGCESPMGCQPATLKRSGPHRVVIRADRGAGSLRLRLYKVEPDVKKEVKLGKPVDVQLSVGQAGSVTFDARAPARILVRLTSIDLSGHVVVLGPDGQRLSDEPATLIDAGGSMLLGPRRVGRGTYTIYIRGADNATGGLRVEVEPAPGG